MTSKNVVFTMINKNLTKTSAGTNACILVLGPARKKLEKSIRLLFEISVKSQVFCYGLEMRGVGSGTPTPAS